MSDDEFLACTGDPCTLQHDHELHRHGAEWKAERLDIRVAELEATTLLLTQIIDEKLAAEKLSEARIGELESEVNARRERKVTCENLTYEVMEKEARIGELEAIVHGDGICMRKDAERISELEAQRDELCKTCNIQFARIERLEELLRECAPRVAHHIAERIDDALAEGSS